MQTVGVDIFATKGIEYLIVIVYLLLLVGFWRVLSTPERRAARAAPRRRRAPGQSWFDVRDDYYYHQGHSWATLEADGVVRVGIDDFAAKLLGKPSAIDLPRVGQEVAEGEPGWALEVDSKSIPVLSPVDGRVVEVNSEIQHTPASLPSDPYGGGWLIKVRVANTKASLKNLLRGRLAHSWMQETLEKLRGMRAGELGIVMPDGGAPVDGFVRVLAPDRWDEVAREFLLSD